MERVTKMLSGNKLRCCSRDLTEGEEEWEPRMLLCVVSILTEYGTIEELYSKMPI